MQYMTLQILHWLLSSHHPDLLSSANCFSASSNQFQSLYTGLGSEELPLYFLGNFLLFCRSSPSFWLLCSRADNHSGAHKDAFMLTFLKSEEKNEDNNNDYISLYTYVVMTYN